MKWALIILAALMASPFPIWIAWSGAYMIRDGITDPDGIWTGSGLRGGVVIFGWFNFLVGLAFAAAIVVFAHEAWVSA